VSTEAIRKSKAYVVNANDEVLILTRSQQEDTRKGGDDLVGGKHIDEHETPISSLLREFAEELPEATIQRIRILDFKRPRMKTNPLTKASELVVSNFAVVTAIFPEDDDIALSEEHDRARWVPRTEIDDLNLPGKYKLMAKIFEPEFQNLVELARLDRFQAEPQERPHLELLEAA
jgi:8-oxo-dGTP pyrophosphatase MutT (NUDIX family)